MRELTAWTATITTDMHLRIIYMLGRVIYMSQAPVKTGDTWNECDIPNIWVVEISNDFEEILSTCSWARCHVKSEL